MNKLINSFKKRLFLLFLFFSVLYSVNNQEILNLTYSNFSEKLPGLTSTIESKNSGKWFELEAALYAEKYLNEKVYGFSLDIEVVNFSKSPIFVPLNNYLFELKTTEYDIVTQNYVFECKMFKSIKKNFSCKQFKKERNMLLFFKNIFEELNSNNLKAYVTFKHSRKRIYSILTLNGKCTGYQDVSLTSKWVNGKTLQECSEQWLNIIKILSTRSLYILFKNPIGEYLTQKLEFNGFTYRSYVSM